MVRLSPRSVCWRLVLVLIPLLPCLRLQADDCVPVSCCGSQHVFIFRGGVGYWPKVSRLENRLKAQGFQTSMHFPCEFVSLPAKIERELRSGQLRPPLVFIGYSSGADAVCLTSRRLQTRGIGVQTAILVEPTLGVDLPANVQYCRNYYKSSPMTDWFPALRGVAIAKRGAGSRLENIDVRRYPGLRDLYETNHLTIASAPSMQNRIESLLVTRHASPFRWQAAPKLQTPPSLAPIEPENRILPASTAFEWSRSESPKR